MDESLEQVRERTATSPLSNGLRRSVDSARQWMVARAATLMCGSLLSVMALNMVSVLWQKSITIDEIVMIPAAYYHLVAGNFQLVNDHPPLAKIIAAVPLLFVQPIEARPSDIPGPPQSDAAKWAYQERFWEDNRASFEAISFWSRVPMIVLTVALGILIFVFARKLFGNRVAVLAVALYSLEPTVLAHGRVVQTDVPAAFGFLLVGYTFYRYLLAPVWHHALWLGIAVGVAIIAKFSMLIVGPILTLTYLVLLWRAPGGKYQRKTLTVHAVVVTLAALLVIHAAYYFRSRALTEADAVWIAHSFPSHTMAVSNAVSALSYVLPTDMVLGVFWQIWHNGQGHPGSLLGMYRATGWWFYFPVAFALKVPLPFLLLSLAALGWMVHAFITKRDKRLLILLIPFTLYTVFVLFSRINIGVRYYLPAFPFLFIAGGAFLDWLWRRARPIGIGIATILLCWMAVEAVRAYPDQMTYFNQLAASRPHWWYLSDSNVEWGDDVRILALYLDARGETRVRAALLGARTLKHYGIDYIDLLQTEPGEPPATRYEAIGASFLNGSTVPANSVIRGHRPSEDERVNFFDSYRHRTPEVIFGNSIYLYRLHE